MDADTDLMLTVGIVLLVLSVPSLLAAWAETPGKNKKSTARHTVAKKDACMLFS